jgi:hypothetical protein
MYIIFNLINVMNSNFIKSNKNDGDFPWWPIYSVIVSRSILLRMRNALDKICRENQKRIFCSITFFF